MKTVPVTLPDWVWGRAATLAEGRNVKVGDLIAEGLRAVLAERLRKTHCVNGHPLSGDNVHLYVRNGRVVRRCRTCNREAVRAWNARKREAQAKEVAS